MADETMPVVHIPPVERGEEKPGFDANYPADVRYDPNLTWFEKTLYVEIRALASQRGFCWAGNEYFEKVFEVDKRTVQRGIKKLQENNYIIVMKAVNDVNSKVYRIIRIAGSKIATENDDKNVAKSTTKMSQKTRQNCHPVNNTKDNINNIYKRAGARDDTTSKNKKQGFNSFSQRQYDFDAIENAIINRPVDSQEGADTG